MDSSASGETIDSFDLLLGRFEVSCPSRYHFFHRRRWRREPHLFAVGMHYGVVLSEQGILDHNLDAENVGEDREGCRNEGRERLSKVIICKLECLQIGTLMSAYVP